MESEIDPRLMVTVNTLLKYREFDHAHELTYKLKIAESISEETWQRLEGLILKKEYPDDQSSFTRDPLDTTDLQFPFDASNDASSIVDDLEERTVHHAMVIPPAIQKKAYALLLDDQLEEAETLLALNDIDEKTIAQFIADSKK